MTYQFRLREEPFDFSYEFDNYDNGLLKSDPQFADVEKAGEISQRPRVAGAVSRSRPPLRHPRPLRTIIRPWRVSAGVIHEPSTCTCPEQTCPQHGSEYIRWVQSTLNRILGMRLPLNGVLTPATRSAVRSFQEREKLPVTGIVGPDTERALIAARSGQSPGADATKPDEPGMTEPPEPAATPPEPDSAKPAAEFDFEWETADEEFEDAEGLNETDPEFEPEAETEFDPENFESELTDSEWEKEIRRGLPFPARGTTGYRQSGRPPRPMPNRPWPPRLPLGGYSAPPLFVGHRVVRAPASCTCPEQTCPQHGSEYIRWVQSTLNRILGMRLPLNGVLTPATRSAIRGFQEREKLPVTGIVGPDTERTLIAASSGQSAGAGATKPVEPGMMEPPEPAATPPEPGMTEPAEPASSSSAAEFEFEWEEEDTRSSPDSIRWVLPADVRAAGEAQSVRYDSPPAWAGDPGNCTGALTQGAKELKQHIRANFVPKIGGYNCRRNTANEKETSVHGTGRALDIYIPRVGGRANSAVGDPIANWLILNASAIGIQLIIWNRVKWSGHKSAPKDRPYQGSPHTDHIHAELNNDGAGRKTAWFRRSQGGVGQPSTGGAKPPAELVRFAQRVLNATERERLDDDGDLGRLTRGALARFRTRYGLGPGGVLDAKTELALAQSALEAMAQQSIFAQPGVLDATTEQALITFKSDRGLGFNATLDAATRAALTDGLSRRASAPGGSVPVGALDRIIQVATQSKIARYRWRERGVSPPGYIKGMALVYARAYCKLKAGDAAATEMAKANTGNTDKDALAHYAQEFNAVGMDNESAGVGTLRHLFVLLIGLGMRESSGSYCRGRDRSAPNTAADTAEAGLFQTSFNARGASPLLPQLFQQYLANPSGFLEIFKEGARCRDSDRRDFGSGPGKEFQRLSKECPAFAAEFTAVALRSRRNHWGPIKRKTVEIRPECDAMLLQVQKVVDEFKLCPVLNNASL